MTDPTTDPMEILAVPSDPVAPRPAFTLQLRHDLRRSLGLEPESDLEIIDLPPRRHTMTTSTASDPSAETAAPATGHPTGVVTPYLAVGDGAAAIDFYRRAFGAVELIRVADDQGRIGHAEFAIGTAHFYLADEFPEFGVTAPTTVGGTTVTLHLDVADVDTTFGQATGAGATSLAEPEDQPHGARHGTLVDPFGHRWMLSQQLETVDPEEYDRRLRSEGEPWRAVEPDAGAAPTTGPAPTGGGIWPAVAATDAPALIRFLVDVVGFTEQLVVDEGDGIVGHSQLQWPDGGIVQVATANRPGDVYSRRPVGAGSVYVVTPDPAAVHRRCVAAGADIIDPPRAVDYDPGGSVFSLRDPEGNIWSFGTYAGEA